LKLALNIIGWFAILLGAFNGGIRLFGTSDFVARYAGNTRSVDLSITFIVFGLILIALASIIRRLDELLKAKITVAPDE
jgi:multisubunit Na+/H+ antiporter MnhG subunit